MCKLDKHCAFSCPTFSSSYLGKFWDACKNNSTVLLREISYTQKYQAFQTFFLLLIVKLL